MRITVEKTGKGLAIGVLGLQAYYTSGELRIIGEGNPRKGLKRVIAMIKKEGMDYGDKHFAGLIDSKRNRSS